jgi:hypothetical protein
LSRTWFLSFLPLPTLSIFIVVSWKLSCSCLVMFRTLWIIGSWYVACTFYTLLDVNNNFKFISLFVVPSVENMWKIKRMYWRYELDEILNLYPVLFPSCFVESLFTWFDFELEIWSWLMIIIPISDLRSWIWIDTMKRCLASILNK